jgi:uncharacterized protein YndB with AHSA1/START domain
MKNTARVVLFMIALALLPSVCRAQDDNRLVHEAIVNAPLDQVWAAFTTREGLESWMAAHAEIELKLGGTMKTQYDPKGTIDDAKAIENDSQLRAYAHAVFQSHEGASRISLPERDQEHVDSRLFRGSG